MQLVHGLHFRNLRGDLFGGLTAAIVALPLALAFGVSVSPDDGAIMGLYGAVFIGFFAALFGGTPAQISGPTGPMTVVMATVFSTLVNKNPETGLGMAFTVVMLGGIFQILFGVLRLGKYITLMPYTVISGFMSGIGFIILFLQIGPFFGHPGSANVIQSLQNLSKYVNNPNPVATGLGALTLIIVFGSPTKVNRIIPAPLLALVVCTLISVFVFPDSGIPIIGKIPTGLPKLQLPLFELDQIRDMVGYGLMLGILGSIDSLLTSLVADNITRTTHDSDKELIGQGIGNLFVGLFGGLPGAGATMRTVVNVRAGGKTPISGMVHALVLLVIVLGAGKLTENIPNAVLAGILIKVGIDIIDWSFLKRAHMISMRATGLMYGVLFLTVFVDLITAVAVGVFCANLLTLKRLSDLQAKEVQAVTIPNENNHKLRLSSREEEILKQAKGRILLFHLSGPMSFGAAKAISQQMSIIENYDILILELSEVPYVGVTASLAIENMVKEAYENRRTVYLVGASGIVEDRLLRLKILRRVLEQNPIDTRLEALEKGIVLISQRQGH
ncbi:SulP family inorganic anion transporter [Plectonema cf. radiosum LEGE 06105]|uniref:SulP family inorganic anion transporter n=1 Tax=Plectonema cf. radiosum LEGE 06105 TaxID=945769 RepID=A0A8J7F318_9CYAN|nr:SulP family inorganic anion transporter [Plectonema radiosum]MBE9214052.1 SulP family inorganic anion transporter [Plectonema cf. radiosum LEGE 06105]